MKYYRPRYFRSCKEEIIKNVTVPREAYYSTTSSQCISPAQAWARLHEEAEGIHMLKIEGGASSSTGAEAPGIRGVKRGHLGNDSPIKVIFFLFSVSSLTDVQLPCSDKVLSESRHSCARPLPQELRSIAALFPSQSEKLSLV